jgi:hypothetical protein
VNFGGPHCRAISFLKTFGSLFSAGRISASIFIAAQGHDIGRGVLEIRAELCTSDDAVKCASIRIGFVEMTALHGFREDVAELFADPELALRGFTGFIVTH